MGMMSTIHLLTYLPCYPSQENFSELKWISIGKMLFYGILDIIDMIILTDGTLYGVDWRAVSCPNKGKLCKGIEKRDKAARPAATQMTNVPNIEALRRLPHNTGNLYLMSQ